jgi:pimeloyl-ACP methyl ester carboxylesterase
MARDVVALMRGLGHERFAVVGHDRGSYVALRTALDHPGAVTHLGGRTSDLRGGGRIDSGHHMAEEAPEELAAALVPFLATAPRSAEESGNPA